jgi:hypothetical protein
VRVVERIPGYEPAGQRGGRIGVNPLALSRPVREALERREAEASAAVAPLRARGR